ncbi:uncharacterized protein BDV17DRAFT_287085 [Aspergillus undulatus]|uniref:uncharacterized protein n=1 Tax=Aspergillus undulatus TaxID=1810928 RepID=UPI003CCE1BF1
MSRNFFPVAMAIAFGVATGYYTFQPELKNLQNKGTSQGSGFMLITDGTNSRNQNLPPAAEKQQQQSAITSTPSSQDISAK